MGLLDAFNSPDGQLGLGLLAAAAPSMTPMNFAGRLGQANQNFQASQASALQRQDLAQQIQLRNIALQQQQKEWAIQLPMLQALADRMNGKAAPSDGSAPDATSTPSIPPSSGGALGSGLFGIPTGGQTATAPATSAAPQGGGSMFPGVPDSVAFPAAAFGGMKAVIPLMSKYNEPTELQKLARAAGVQEGSQQWNQIMQGGLSKANYIAPVNARPGSILRDPITGKPFAFNPHIPDGSTPTFDASGNVVGMSPIDGATAAITAAEKAKALGTAQVTPTVAYGPGGKPVFSTKAQDVERATNPWAGLPPAQTGVQGKFVGDPASVIAGIANIKDPQERANAYEAFAAQLKAGSGSLPAAGGLTPEQQPGLVPNADAAQKASAQTMHESYAKLQSGGSTATAALDALDKMIALGAKKYPYLQAGPLGTKTTMISPDAAEYEKQRANVVALMAQQLGAGGTDAGRANIGESVPDYGKPQAAIADGLATLRNQVVQQQIKREFLTPHFQAGDSKQYTTLENQFDQNVSPSMVPLLKMPPGTERAAAVKEASKDPAMRAKLNWAIQNGLVK